MLETNSQQIAMVGFNPRRANAQAGPLTSALACFLVRAGGKGRGGHWPQYKVKALKPMLKEQDVTNQIIVRPPAGGKEGR